LHVTEQGEGPAVLFCHGFPDTSYTWRRQMKAVASAGYRAIAPDMRGYGRSSAPADASQYTPFHTAGDLVGLLDALKISSAVLVGHDDQGGAGFPPAALGIYAGSRILEIDPVKNQIVWQYTGGDSGRPV
jgi:pimeloyl-ACP methyl ester carboxylesterase